MSRGVIKLLALTFLIYGVTRPSLAISKEYDCLKDPEVMDPAEHIPFGNHLFWRIRCKNVKGVDCSEVKDSYIFGTMHLPLGINPHVDIVLRQSNKVVTEIINNEEQMQAYWDEAFYSKDSGASIADHLTAEDFKKLEKVIRPYEKAFQLPKEDFIRLKPWAMSNLISRPVQKTAVMDQVIIGRAKISGSKVFVGLEGMSDLVRALTNSSIEDQEIILRSAINDRKEISTGIKTLKTLYLQKNLTGIAVCNQKSYGDDPVNKRLMESTLYQRNPIMVDGIIKHITKEYFVKTLPNTSLKKIKGNSFIAVGANHLPGSRGILQTLEENGFEITPFSI